MNPTAPGVSVVGVASLRVPGNVCGRTGKPMVDSSPNPKGVWRRCAVVVAAMALAFGAVSGAGLLAGALHERKVRPVDHAALGALQGGGPHAIRRTRS